MISGDGGWFVLALYEQKHTHEVKFWEESVIRILLPMLLYSNKIEQQELFRLHVLMLFYQLQHWYERQQHKYVLSLTVVMKFQTLSGIAV